MFCTACGHELPEGTKFCPNCGQNVNSVAQSSPVTNPPSPPPQQQSARSSANKLIMRLPAKLEKQRRAALGLNEKIHVQLKGLFSEALICTDIKVIILKSGLVATDQIFGVKAFQVPYRNISGVEVNVSFATGYLEIFSGGMQNTEKKYWSKKNSPQKAPNCISLGSSDVGRFREASNFILSRIGNPSPLPQSESVIDPIGRLERLATLREKGLLTQEEFDAKKADILKQIGPS